MASLEELEATLKPRSEDADAEEEEEVYDDTDADDDEDPVMEDVTRMFDKLEQCMHLLDYMSDVVLCKSITKRERDSMARLSDSVKELLDEVDEEYFKEERE